MDFEWDPRKAENNFRKHRIEFVDTVSVFDDDRAIVIEDEHPDDSEERFVIFGMDADGRILAVAHTISGDNIRIISARLATPDERAQYEDKRI
jgi:uncharacterized DUF497 family protein